MSFFYSAGIIFKLKKVLFAFDCFREDEGSSLSEGQMSELVSIDWFSWAKLCCPELFLPAYDRFLPRIANFDPLDGFLRCFWLESGKLEIWLLRKLPVSSGANGSYCMPINFSDLNHLTWSQHSASTWSGLDVYLDSSPSDFFKSMESLKLFSENRWFEKEDNPER
jgi:hypothetical protein